MNSRRRYVVVGIAGIALLLAVTLTHGFQWIWIRFGWADPHLFSLRELPLTTALAAFLSFGAAFFCLKHGTTRHFLGEVADELAKVSWPSREETSYATVVVIVTVFICAIYIGVFDAFWMWVTNWVLGVNGTAG